MITAVTRTGLCAIIRCREPGWALPIGRVLLEHGVEVLEVTLTTPDADIAIAALAREAHTSQSQTSQSQTSESHTGGNVPWIGAGSVITVADVERAQAAGARFVVTPGVCPAITESSNRGLPVLGGAWTASEVIAARAAGSSAVKIFPARSGGPDHLRALRDPLPEVPLVAVGGVGLAEIEAYRAAGAIAVGVGSPLIGEAATGGSLTDLAKRARQFVAACRP